MTWEYYYNDRWKEWSHPTSYRRTNGVECQQLKDTRSWGYSEARRLEGSIRVPDLLLILNGYPLC